MTLKPPKRSSLRLSVRGQHPLDHLDHRDTDPDPDASSSPPTKKQRVLPSPDSGGDHHQHAVSRPTTTATHSAAHCSPSTRRENSPGFLDVAIDDRRCERPRPLSLRHSDSSKSKSKSKSKPKSKSGPTAQSPSPATTRRLSSFSSSSPRNAASASTPPSSSVRPAPLSYSPGGNNIGNSASREETDRDRRCNHDMATVTPATPLLKNGNNHDRRVSPGQRDAISPVTSASLAAAKKGGVNGRGDESNWLSGSSVQHPVNKGSLAGKADTTVQGKEANSTTTAGCSQSANGSSTAAATATTTAAGTARRSLRSHDAGARSRCELASYFPNYEELISLDPPAESGDKSLTGETTVKLIDDVTIPALPPPSATESPFGNPLLHICEGEVIALPDPEPSDDAAAAAAAAAAEDPLSEDMYFRAHRRFDRQEKQLRNIERERAQHEKLQLDRILDELRSNDWLRVMGIGGVSDAEKKLHEPKRDFFIKEISALVEKFRSWRKEEKRRKVEKEKMSSLLQDASPSGPDDVVGTQQQRGEELGKPATEQDIVHPDGEDDDGGAALSDALSHGDSSDTNEVDVWAAQQLHQEVRSASTPKRPKVTYTRRRRQRQQQQQQQQPTEQPADDRPSETNVSNSLPPPPPPPEPKPLFTSFFPKRSLRDFALSTKNRLRRTRLAFGQPLPEMEEREFELPPDILTHEAIQAGRRRRRRVRREARVEGQAV